MITIIQRFFPVLFLMIFALPASAEMTHKGALHLKGFTIRATTPNAGATAGYGIIYNHGDEDDRLISAQASFAKKTEIHEMLLDGDVMRMREIDGGLMIAANSQTELKKGGLHIMFLGLSAQIKTEQAYEITLEFEKAGTVIVPAKTIALREPKSHDQDHDHNHGHKHKH